MIMWVAGDHREEPVEGVVMMQWELAAGQEMATLDGGHGYAAFAFEQTR